MKKKPAKARQRQTASVSRKHGPSRTAARSEGRSATKSATKSASTSARRWSAEVTRRSNALDLEPGVFTGDDPRKIAASLKRSAETSTRKKTDSFRSALSMLNFYINRAGVNLSDLRRRILTRAKDELRRQFGR
jgi:hypothetical protein